MKAKTLQTKVARGTPIYVRYKDHILFKDVKAEDCLPWIRETRGWLDYEDDKCIRIIWERSCQPHLNVEATLRQTGIVILKATILEVKADV